MPSSATPNQRRPVLIELTCAFTALAISIIARAVWSWSGPFLPSPAYNWPVALMYALSAAIAFAVYVFFKRRYPTSDAERYDGLPVNHILALVTGLALGLACALPLQVLHSRSEPSISIRTEPISLSREGERGSCKHHALIEGNSELRGSRLCIGSNEALYRQLDQSRRVELTISRSRYGTAVDSFKPAPTEARPGAATPQPH